MSDLVEPLDPEIFGPEQPCFGCGPRHPIGLHLRFAREGEMITTRFVPGEQYQGPPGIMHGGLVMTAADELAAWTVLGLRERFGFTASVECRLQRPVRVGIEVVGQGRITRDTSRIVGVEVTLEQQGATSFRGKFSFVLMDESAAEKMLGMSIPQAWRRFCR